MNALAILSVALVVSQPQPRPVPTPEPSIPQLIKDLKSPDVNTRGKAIDLLGRLGPKAKEAIPNLIDVLEKDPIGDFRLVAAESLGKMGAEARAALPALRAALKDPDRLVRVFAAEAMFKTDPETLDDALTALIEALKFSKDEPVDVPPFFVYERLRRLGPKARRAEAAVMEGLKTRDLTIRLESLATLDAIGSDNEALVALVVALLRDKNYDHLSRVLEKGGRIFFTPLLLGQVDQVRDDLRDFRYDLIELREVVRLTREVGAVLLGKMGPKAKAAVPTLQELLKEPYPEVRKAAREALEKIQGKP